MDLLLNVCKTHAKVLHVRRIQKPNVRPITVEDAITTSMSMEKLSIAVCPFFSTAKLKTLVAAEEEQGCFCTQQYDPVCGTDNKTYGNQCEANCQNVQVECTGECPCKKSNGRTIQFHNTLDCLQSAMELSSTASEILAWEQRVRPIPVLNAERITAMDALQNSTKMDSLSIAVSTLALSPSLKIYL